MFLYLKIGLKRELLLFVAAERVAVVPFGMNRLALAPSPVGIPDSPPSADIVGVGWGDMNERLELNPASPREPTVGAAISSE